MNKFSYQITLVILITTVSIAFLVGYIGLQSNLEAARAQAEEQLLASTQVAARKCEVYFQAQESSALAIKNMVASTYNPEQEAVTSQYLDDYRQLVGPAIKASAESTPGCAVACFWLDSLTSAEPYALSYCRDTRKDVFVTLPDPPREQFDPERSDMQWFYRSLEERSSSWSAPFYSARTGRTLIPFSTPAVIDGKTAGIVCQAIDVQTLRQVLYDVNLYSSGYAEILDPQCAPLVEWRQESDEDGSNRRSDTVNFLANNVAADKEGVVLVTEDGTEASATLYSAYVRLNNGFIVVVAVPESELLAPVINVQHMYWGIFALFFAISAVLAIIWGRQLSRPLKSALEYAEALASRSGDEEILCHMAKRTDEFGDIARKLEEAVYNHSEEIRSSHMELIYRLSQVSRLRDYETACHVSRVSNYAALLASLAGLELHAVMNIFLTASMHDIGKIGIPDYILLKPGPLNDEEYEVMKKHPLIGAAIFEDGSWPMLQIAHIMTLYHHERWDGRGYPAGLNGEQIPAEARICGLCDAFDAMTSPRIYRKSLSFEEAVQEVERNSGRQFDPELVAIFMDNIAGFRIIYDLQDEFILHKGRRVEENLHSICAISGLVQGLNPAL